MRHGVTTLLAAAAWLLGGCTIDDADRCPAPLVWNEAYASCECDEGYYLKTDPDDATDALCEPCTEESTAAECDTDTDSQTDTGTDADAGDGGGSGTGLGEPCTGDEDCAEFEADSCALNPLEPEDPGYCTYADCEPGGCPAPYSCCDLSGLGLGVACLNEADAVQAEGFGGTCD